MPYLSLYRKYRSQTFEELSGQEHVTRTLRNAIASGKIGHAYLFCGPRGTGKTSTARLLAKALNCEQGPAAEPCNRCDHCVQITEGRHLDVREIDAASNRGIDDIRDLRDAVQFAPAAGRYKVYIVDEAHQITTEGFNAFLKTLEEPPPGVVFVLASTEARRIPATILSRCQRFEFHRGSLDQIRERVRWVAEQEGAHVEPDALDLIAAEANGGWRDALAVLEQVLAFCPERVTAEDVHDVLGSLSGQVLYTLAQAVLDRQAPAAFNILTEQFAAGKDPRQLLHDLTGHFRTLLRAASGQRDASAEEIWSRISTQAQAFGYARLVSTLELLAEVERDSRWTEQPMLYVELAMARLLAGPVSRSEASAAAGPPAASAAAAGVERSTSPVRHSPGPARRPDLPAPPQGPTAGDARACRDLDAPGYDPWTEPQEGAASAPAPETAPPAPAAGSGAATIAARWRVVHEELGRMHRRNICTVLAGALPESLEKDVLTIRFPSQTLYELFVKRSAEFGGPLREAIRRVTGIDCTIHPVLDAGARASKARERKTEPQPAPFPQPADPTPSGSALVHEVIDLFDGRVVDEE